MSPMRLLAVLAALSLTLLPGTVRAEDDPVAQGVTSSNVQYVHHAPFEVGTATGARVVGKYLYLTGWRSISIYDISTPENPQLVNTTPIGFQFENEDVATNGKIMLFSQTTPTSNLHVWDVANPASPREIATLAGAGQHTMSCLYDCQWGYGSAGAIVDLRDPANPKRVGDWRTATGGSGSHDLIEVRPGLVLTASRPMRLLDTTDPAKPVLIAKSGHASLSGGHSVQWPNDGTDRFILGATETNAHNPCDQGAGGYSTWDTTGWQETGTFQLIDYVRMRNGIGTDGSPPANGLGCSAHWFQQHPSFRNGGLTANGFYEHGTRFFRISGRGVISEAGYFMPYGGSTSSPYWITDRIVYAIDYTRGIDILRYTGALGPGGDDANAVTDLSAEAGASSVNVSGKAKFSGESPVQISVDPTGDAPAGADVGADLTGARVHQPDAGDARLVFEWTVNNLPQPLPPEGVRYVWTFGVEGKQYQLQAKLTNLASTTEVDDPAGHPTHLGRSFQLRGNCGTLVAINNCPHLTWLDGQFDPAAKTIRIFLPIGAPYAPEVKPGALLSPAGAPPIYAAYQAVVSNSSTWDEGELVDEGTYTVPGRTVALGIAPAGADPDKVEFGPAEPVSGNAFSGSLATAGRPAGTYDVFARACFGTACSVGTTQVTIA
jgi:hypothetical protein